MANPPDIDELLERAGRGDLAARQALLHQHRDRLRRMVSCRMDPRLRQSVDASDIVPESLAEAWKKLSEYLAAPPLPVYPWLRQFAWNRLIDLHRRHVLAQRRSVRQEVSMSMRLPDESASNLAASLASLRSGQRLRYAGAESLRALTREESGIPALRHGSRTGKGGFSRRKLTDRPVPFRMSRQRGGPVRPLTEGTTKGGRGSRCLRPVSR